MSLSQRPVPFDPANVPAFVQRAINSGAVAPLRSWGNMTTGQRNEAMTAWPKLTHPENYAWGYWVNTEVISGAFDGTLTRIQQVRGVPGRRVNARPRSAKEDGTALLMEDVDIFGVIDEGDAVQTKYSDASPPSGSATQWAFGSITGRRVRVWDYSKPGGSDAHTDNWQHIFGGGHNHPTDILLEDCILDNRGCRAQDTLFQPGMGGSLVVRRTSFLWTHQGVKVSFDGTATARLPLISIEDCPGDFGLYVIGKADATPGKIRIVRSPGVVVSANEPGFEVEIVKGDAGELLTETERKLSESRALAASWKDTATKQIAVMEALRGGMLQAADMLRNASNQAAQAMQRGG